MEKILSTIDVRITNHRLALEAAGDYHKQLKTKLFEGKAQLANKDSKAFATTLEIQQIMGEIDFHRTCLKCLEDLRKELSNG